MERVEEIPLFPLFSFPGHQEELHRDTGSGTVTAEATSRFLQFGRKGTLRCNQRTCGCESREQILIALYLVWSPATWPQTDTVTGLTRQTREIKAPAFWPENQERRLPRRKRAKVKDKGGRSREQSHEVGYELLAHL